MEKEIKRCTRCLIPTSLPSVKTDRDGVCQFCRRIDALRKQSKTRADKTQQEFERIVEKVKGRAKPYDCLIPLSGGKDSTYVLYLCDRVYDLRCLCVTFDNGYLSDHARKNIDNAIAATNADHIYYKANPNVLHELYGLFLKKTGNLCPACMRGIEVATQIAYEKYRPPLVIYGGGRKVTYVGLYPELFQGGDVRFFRNVIKGESVRARARAFLAPWTSRQVSKGVRELLKLFRLQDAMVGSYTYYVNIYDYIDASFEKIRQTLEREMGWKSPEGSFEHMDCQLHYIPAYIHTLKFPELTPTTLYNSHQVRLGLMTRDEALQIEEANLRNRQEPRGLEMFLADTGVSREEFYASTKNWTIMDGFRDKTNEAIRAFYRRIAGR
jgi:hypothetical protein